MKICVVGLGYVGAVSAGLLAKEGHEVIGVDPERAKVELINEGRSPIIEKDLGEIIAEQVKAGRLRATTVVEDAVRHTDFRLRLRRHAEPRQRQHRPALHPARVRADRRGAARPRPGAPSIVIRSTMLPGTMRDVVIPIARERPASEPATTSASASTPSSCAKARRCTTTTHPPKTVIGELNAASGDLLAASIEGIPRRR